MKQGLRKKHYMMYSMILSVFFLLFYSANTSPLYPGFYGWDSAFFTLAGRMVLGGKTLYVDIIDSKGPLLYWLYALGEAVCSREGIWYIQAVLFCTSIYFAHQTIRLFIKEEKQAFFTLCLGMLVWMGTFENGGLTEELSLLFLISGSYFIVRYFREGEITHKPVYAIWYGTCFSCMLLIRVTNAAMLCGLVAAVVVMLISRKQWKNLFQNAGCFLIGTAIILIPVGWYFIRIAAIDDLILGMFRLAGNYAGYGAGRISFRAMAVWFGKNSLLLFSMTAAWLYARREDAKCGYAVLFSQSALMLVLMLGNGYLHYFTLVVPAFYISMGMLYQMLGGWSMTAVRKFTLKSRKITVMIAALFFVAVVYYGKYSALTTGGNLLKAVTRYYEDTYDAIKEQTELIPEEERNSVLAYNIRPRWYVIGELQPCYRLGAYQENFTRLIPELAKEQEEKLNQDPPVWVAVEQEYLDCPQLEEMLKKDYEKVDETEGITLYSRKSIKK